MQQEVLRLQLFAICYQYVFGQSLLIFLENGFQHLPTSLERECLCQTALPQPTQTDSGLPNFEKDNALASAKWRALKPQSMARVISDDLSRFGPGLDLALLQKRFFPMRVTDFSRTHQDDAREVEAFLDRHGFVDMHSERSSSGYTKVRMEPLLASDLAYMLPDM